jgi:hypothetical protein
MESLTVKTNIFQCGYRFCKKKSFTHLAHVHGNRKYCDRDCYLKERALLSAEKRKRIRLKQYEKAKIQLAVFLDNHQSFMGNFTWSACQLKKMFDHPVRFEMIWNSMREFIKNGEQEYYLQNAWRKPFHDLIREDDFFNDLIK